MSSPLAAAVLRPSVYLSEFFFARKKPPNGMEKILELVNVDQKARILAWGDEG
jgi:hypothetical protein